MGGGELPLALLGYWVIIFRERLHDKCTLCDTDYGAVRALPALS